MIQLNYRGVRPVCEQVRSGLRHLVVTGALQVGDKLPSMRMLALLLTIDPSTIQRAYESLEQESCLYTVANKGSFTAPQAGVNAARGDRLLRKFDTSAAELLFLGMTAGRLAGRLETTARRAVREERSYD